MREIYLESLAPGEGVRGRVLGIMARGPEDYKTTGGAITYALDPDSEAPCLNFVVKQDVGESVLVKTLLPPRAATYHEVTIGLRVELEVSKNNPVFDSMAIPRVLLRGPRILNEGTNAPKEGGQ